MRSTSARERMAKLLCINQMDKKDYKVGLFIWTSVAITMLCVVYGLIIYQLRDKGVFGDMFGALTAWFSGLAFAGIIYTILQQKTELSYQREELRLTREEFRTQNETLKKQRFENTFFNLLSYHNKIIETIYFSEGTYKGDRHDAFQFAYNSLKGKANDLARRFRKSINLPANNDFSDLSQTQTEGLLAEAIKQTLNNSNHNIHLFFQNIRQLLKLIYKSDILHDETERLFYATIIRDQLTGFEKAMILYYCLLPDRWVNTLNFLVYKLRILDDLPDELLLTFWDKEIGKKWAITVEPNL